MAISFCFPLGSFALLLLLPLLSQSHILTNSSSPPSPFAFLQHLKGCHKGDNLKDISKLKHYLGKFGYLDYNNNNTIRKKSNHSKDNYFDHLLEKAIKTYQTNYHLNTTGALDSDTVATMMSPRCGVADIVNGTNWMQGRGHHHPHGLRTVSHFSFFPGSPRWRASKTRLTYGFLPGTPARAMDAVSKAYMTWAQNTHFKFERASGGNTRPDMTIGFHSRGHGDGAPFDGPGGTIAHAFAPENGRFHYDAEEPWGLGRRDAFDLETVALHEIGHLLGLGHSSVEGAIMYPTISLGAKKGLNQDDIRGIRALYGV